MVHLWPLLGVPHTKVAVRRSKSGGEPPHAEFDPRPVRRICKKERQKPPGGDWKWLLTNSNRCRTGLLLSRRRTPAAPSIPIQFELMGAGGLCLAVAFRPIWRRRVAPPKFVWQPLERSRFSSNPSGAAANRHGGGLGAAASRWARARARATRSLSTPPGAY